MRKLLITLFVFSYIGIHAQPLTERLQIRFSELHKNSLNCLFYSAIPIGYSNSTSYFLLLNYLRNEENAIGNKNNCLIKVGKDLKPLLKTSLEYRQDGKDTWDEHHVMLHGTLYVFFSYLNRSLKKEFLFAKVIDTATLKPVGDLKKVAEVDYSAFHKYKPRSFQFHYSPDSSRVLISYAITNKEGMISSQGFVVLDDKLDEQWSQSNALPLEPDKFYLMDKYLVTNEGDVHVVTKAYKTEKDFWNSGRYPYRFGEGRNFIEYPRFTYEIFTLNKTERGRFTPSVPGYFIRTLGIACPKPGLMICSGLISDSGFVSVRGSFNIMVEQNVSRLSSKFLFPNEMIGKGMNAEDYEDVINDLEKRREFETCVYNNFDLQFSDDGGFWFLAEQKRERQGRNSMLNFYEGIYILRYTKDGTFLWANKLSKSQYDGYTIQLFCSAKVISNKDELLVIYNETPSPYDLVFSSSYFNSKVMALSYDKDGKESKRCLFTTEETDVVMMPPYVQKVADDTYYFFTSKSLRKYKFMELKL